MVATRLDPNRHPDILWDHKSRAVAKFRRSLVLPSHILYLRNGQSELECCSRLAGGLLPFSTYFWHFSVCVT